MKKILVESQALINLGLNRHTEDKDYLRFEAERAEILTMKADFDLQISRMKIFVSFLKSLKSKKSNYEDKKAEKIEKSTLKTQLYTLVDSFRTPEISVENEKKYLIKEKIEAFKNWAKNEIESI